MSEEMASGFDNGEEGEISDYEKIRLTNIAENRRIMLELGLIKPFQEKKPILMNSSHIKKKVSVEIETKSIHKSNESVEPHQTRRLSRRIRGIQADDSHVFECDEDEAGDAYAEEKKKRVKRENVYGHIEGIDVGRRWQTRLECSADSIHRPSVAGIHAGPEGAYSIALSGGYEDDIDLGESITYTGSGGRDLKGTKYAPKSLRTGPQRKDQTLNSMNLALKKSVETGKPVRVIRGYKLCSNFAPAEGFRYDGVYYVKQCWLSPGKSGFLTYKFALQRGENQAPPPWGRLNNSS